MIRCITNKCPKYWDDFLNQVEFAFKSMVNRYTDWTPFNILYTKPSNMTIDIVVLRKIQNCPIVDMVDNYQSMLPEIKKKLTKSPHK